MTLLRSRDIAGGQVRSLAAPSPPPPAPSAPDAERLALRAEVRRLTEAAEAAVVQAAAREVAIEDERRAARTEGHAAGRREGRAEAEDGLGRLDAALRAATDQIGETLETLEGLAARLAREALAQVLDRPQDYGELVAGALRRQMAAVSAQMVLSVEVSSLDFPDPEALDMLAASLGRPDVALAALPGLAHGDCRMRLQLGGVDLDLDGQWTRLKAILDEMFLGAAAP